MSNDTNNNILPGPQPVLMMMLFRSDSFISTHKFFPQFEMEGPGALLFMAM